MADYDQQSTQSGALIGHNDDLLTEILLRLPVISILRFKSVSKQWQSLLSERRFTILYDNGLVSHGLFVHHSYIPFDLQKPNRPPVIDLYYYPQPPGLQFVQSCNGLMLCGSTRGNPPDYYVCNPTTKQFSIIPKVSGSKNVVKNIRLMGLAFHPTDCPHYKVVCIHHARTYGEPLEIQIYSSDIRKWKKISNEYLSVSCFMPFSGGVYWNGAFHWAPSSISPSYFKLDVEKLQTLPLPSPLPVRVKSSGGYKRGERPLYFGESGGHLHLVETTHHETHLHLNVYEMLSDHSGWFVKYQVELDGLQAFYPDMNYIYLESLTRQSCGFEVLDVVRSEKEEEDAFMVIIIWEKIVRYNILEKSFKQILDLTDSPYGCIGPWDVYRYIKTLTSP